MGRFRRLAPAAIHATQVNVNATDPGDNVASGAGT